LLHIPLIQHMVAYHPDLDVHLRNGLGKTALPLACMHSNLT